MESAIVMIWLKRASESNSFLRNKRRAKFSGSFPSLHLCKTCKVYLKISNCGCQSGTVQSSVYISSGLIRIVFNSMLSPGIASFKPRHERIDNMQNVVQVLGWNPETERPKFLEGIVAFVFV